MTALEPTPLPLSHGSRLPPPPTITTTFAGAGGEDDGSEIVLANQTLRLVRRVGSAEPWELPSIAKGLARFRTMCDAELAMVRLVEGTRSSEIWLSYLAEYFLPNDAEKILLATLAAIDDAIAQVQQRMRDLFVPQFASELM